MKRDEIKATRICVFCQYYSDRFCAVNPGFLGNAENCADWKEDAAKLKDHFQKNNWIELHVPSQKEFKEFLQYQATEFSGEEISPEKPIRSFYIIYLLEDPDNFFVYRSEQDTHSFVEVTEKKKRETGFLPGSYLLLNELNDWL
jgi:hypothetical protein